MLPTSAGVEPATSWSPVGRRIQLSHEANPMGSCRARSVYLTTRLLGRLSPLTSIVHILSPETDNCPSWISGRERMTVENISWSISTKECCQSWRGLNPRPPGLQSVSASNWATEASNRLVITEDLVIILPVWARLLTLVILYCMYLVRQAWPNSVDTDKMPLFVTHPAIFRHNSG